MPSQTGPQHEVRRTISFVREGDVLLGCAWLFVLLADAATARLASVFALRFVDVAFGATLLLAGFERSSVLLLAGAALPAFGLEIWLHIPWSIAGLLALGWGSVVALARDSLGGDQTAQQNLRVALLLPMVALLADTANGLIEQITPHTYDAELLRLDHGVSTALHRWAMTQTWRIVAVDAIYYSLPLAVALGIRLSAGRGRRRLLWALCIAPLLGSLCFVLVPAVGQAHVSQPRAYRNCFPSLHLTWAALLWLNARQRWWRAACLAFVLLTAFVALATGEHYWPDLAAAVPFTLLVQWLAGPETEDHVLATDTVFSTGPKSR
ncbi:MAG: phosphatase PAP2 family protein [Acidobacteriota bacterium]